MMRLGLLLMSPLMCCIGYEAVMSVQWSAIHWGVLLEHAAAFSMLALGVIGVLIFAIGALDDNW